MDGVCMPQPLHAHAPLLLPSHTYARIGPLQVEGSTTSRTCEIGSGTGEEAQTVGQILWSLGRSLVRHCPKQVKHALKLAKER
jgi:hypothetical protein